MPVCASNAGTCAPARTDAGALRRDDAGAASGRAGEAMTTAVATYNGKVIGLSKIPRLVDIFARRLQLQERLTNQIAHTILEKIQPLGVAVVCEGTHLCMAMRGVEKQNSYTITSAMLGAFREQSRTRM